jgi:hypothetical protein
MNAIQIKCIDQVWWFVRDGEPFVSLGVNHLQPDCWLAPYNREASLARYGDDLADADGRRFNPDGQGLRRLVDAMIDRIQQWGFNSLGMHTHGVPARLYQSRIPYLHCINAVHLGSRYRFGTDRCPDFFSDAFAERLGKRIRRTAEEHRGCPNLLGYAFTDIPRWYFFGGPPKNRQDRWPIHPFVDDLRSQPASAPGKQQWIDVLHSRYGSAAVAAQIYNLEVRGWEELADVRDWPYPAEPERAAGDSEAMLQRMVGRWYDLHVGFIREFDPHHLIFGDKLHSPDILPDWFAPILRRSVDVMLIQWYRPFDQQEAVLRDLHARTGKPILNGDSCFGCPKPPLQTSVKGYPCRDMEEVAARYVEYLRGIMSLPFMVGWHHCGLMEQWDGGKGTAGELPENGFMDPYEQPHEAFVQAATRINTEATSLHTRSVATGTPIRT